MRIYILIMLITCWEFTNGSVKESQDTCEISFAKDPTDDEINEMKELNWIKIDMITDIDRVQIYSDVTNALLNNDGSIKSEESTICDKYYGMGVEDAWETGYSGHDVIVAVTDVGVNTDITELEKNIDKDLSYNYVNGTKDVTPEFFHNFQDLSWPDHGNRCVSLIAAEKGNGICSAGIAYNATIAVVKIFEIIQQHTRYPIFETKSNSTIMAKSLLHQNGTIHIYSNSWTFKTLFTNLTAAIRSSLKTSAEKGRDGKGAILIFPAGPKINELMNNEYIIAVGAVGKNITIPKDAVITSAVLTSGLHDGNNVTASNMVTTTTKDRCSTQFTGVSAAVAQVAGMIALALEANPNLTREDIEDLIVYSSDYVATSDDQIYLTENAAGLKFDSVFGPGILNASKLVTEARKRTSHVKTMKQYLQSSNISTDGHMAVFCHDCGANGNASSECVGTIKKAQIEVVYKSSADVLIMTLKSPSGTTSVLQTISSNNGEIDTKGYTRKQILTSVHFWDEASHGLWGFKLESNGQRDEIVQIQLTLIGLSLEEGNSTSSYPIEVICDTSNNTTESPVKHNSNHDPVCTILITVSVLVAVAFLVIGVYLLWKHIRKRSAASDLNVRYDVVEDDDIDT